MSVKSCEFECEGEDCNCDSLRLTTGERNLSKFLYVASVALLVVVVIPITLSSIVNNIFLDMLLVFGICVSFIAISVIMLNLPLKYHHICTEHKVYYRDIGTPRIQRKYVFMIDVIISALPLTFFVWDIIHTIVYIEAGVSPSDDIPFMYFWDDGSDGYWNLIGQGWLDFGFATAGLFLLVIELAVWFDNRDGELCTATLSDVPLLGLGEYEGRVKSVEGNYWDDFFKIDERD